MSLKNSIAVVASFLIPMLWIGCESTQKIDAAIAAEIALKKASGESTPEEDELFRAYIAAEDETPGEED